MAHAPGFCGPSARLPWLAVDGEDTINSYLHHGESGTPKVSWSLPPRPTLRHWLTVGGGPIRGSLAQDGRAFVVSGAFLYEVFASQTKIVRGAVAVDANPAVLFANGPLTSDDLAGQLMVISGGNGYVLDLETNGFQIVTDDAFEPPYVTGLYTGTYGVVLKTASNKVQYSANLDFLDWNGLDFFATTLTSDIKVALAVSHQYVFVIGSRRTEVWENVGGISNAFQSVPNTIVEHGTDAPWSVVVLDNTLFYMTADEHGNGLVTKLDGFTPVRISTTPIEALLQGVNLAGVRGWAVQFLGHSFYCLYVPGLDWTLVYDVSTSQWMKWAHWSSTLERFFPLLAQNHMFAFGQHLVGDRVSGNLYRLDFETGSDRIAAGL